jgi:hypothetical protein
VYTLDGRPGYSFIFEGGCDDGFSPHEVAAMLLVSVRASCHAGRPPGNGKLGKSLTSLPLIPNNTEQRGYYACNKNAEETERRDRRWSGHLRCLMLR